MNGQNQVLTVDFTMDGGNIIKPEVIDLSRFNEMPVILQDHQYDYPIGKALNLRLDDTGLHFVPEFIQPGEAKRWLKYLHEEGLLVARPGGIIELNDNGDIDKFVLLEISICPGMNPHALNKYNDNDRRNS